MFNFFRIDVQLFGKIKIGRRNLKTTFISLKKQQKQNFKTKFMKYYSLIRIKDF